MKTFQASHDSDRIEPAITVTGALAVGRLAGAGQALQHLKTLIKIAFSIGIILYLVHRFHLNLSAIHMVHPFYLIAVTVLLIAQPLVMVVRWRLLLVCFGNSLSYAKLTAILFISLFFNQFLPASVGGDAVRIWYGRKEGIALATMAGTVLMDRLCALLGLMLMIVALLPFAHRVIADETVIWGLAALMAAVFAGIAFLLVLRPWTRRPKTSRLMAILAFPTNALYILCEQKKTLFAALFLSIVVHIISAVSLYGIVYAFGDRLSILEALVLLPPIILAQMIPISIGGWGVREVAAVAALTSVGIDPAHALAISLTLGALCAVASLPGAIFWVRYRTRRLPLKQFE